MAFSALGHYLVSCRVSVYLAADSQTRRRRETIKCKEGGRWKSMDNLSIDRPGRHVYNHSQFVRSFVRLRPFDFDIIIIALVEQIASWWRHVRSTPTALHAFILLLLLKR